jgi:hypothetical protein
VQLPEQQVLLVMHAIPSGVQVGPAVQLQMGGVLAQLHIVVPYEQERPLVGHSMPMRGCAAGHDEPVLAPSVVPPSSWKSIATALLPL